MTDQEFKSWLEDQVPKSPSAEFDQKLKSQAQGLLSPQSSTFKFKRILLVVAIILVVLTFLPLVINLYLGRDKPNEWNQLKAFRGGRFEVHDAAKYEFTSPYSRLQLTEGEVRAIPSDYPLEVAFSGGFLNIEKGRCSVNIQRVKDKSMNQGPTSASPIVSFVTVSILTGMTWLDFDSELHLGEPLSLSPKDVVSFNLTENGRLQNFLINGAELAELSLDESLHFLGRIVSAENGKPIPKARVHWAKDLSPKNDGKVIYLSDGKGRRGRYFRSPFEKGIRDTGLWFPFDAQLGIEATTVGTAGYFKLRKPKKGESLIIEADGYKAYLSQVIQKVDKIESGKTYKLSRYHTIEGQVALINGKPIHPAAEVRFYVTHKIPATEKTARWSVDVNEEGRFNIATDDVKEVQLLTSVTGCEDQRLNIQLNKDQKATPLKLILAPRPATFGSIVTTDGKPLQGVDITIREFDGSSSREKRKRGVKTNSKGLFISNVSSTSLELETFKEGFKVWKGKADPNQSLNITLQPAIKQIVEGLVVDSKGHPVKNLGVSATRKAGGDLAFGKVEIESQTQEDGRFKFELYPGRYLMTLHPKYSKEVTLYGAPYLTIVPWSKENRLSLPFSIGTVEVTSDKKLPVLRVNLPEMGSIQGFETSPAQGRPLKQSNIGLLSYGIRDWGTVIAYLKTDLQGKFVFENLAPGRYGLSKDQHIQLIEVESGSNEVFLDTKTAVVAGSVQRDGKPIGVSKVIFGRWEKGELTHTTYCRTNAQGEFEHTKVPLGRVSVLISDQRVTGTTMMTKLDLKENVRGLKIDWPKVQIKIKAQKSLPKNSRVKVKFLEFDGLVLKRLAQPHYLTAGTAQSDDQLNYVLKGVSPGRYLVYFDGEGIDERIEIAVEDQDVTLQLENSSD